MIWWIGHIASVLRFPSCPSETYTCNVGLRLEEHEAWTKESLASVADYSKPQRMLAPYLFTKFILEHVEGWSDVIYNYAWRNVRLRLKLLQKHDLANEMH